MTSQSTNLEPTLADAFDVGKREGQRETLAEIKNLIAGGIAPKELAIYIEARLKTITEFGMNNPFKNKVDK